MPHLFVIVIIGLLGDLAHVGRDKSGVTSTGGRIGIRLEVDDVNISVGCILMSDHEFILERHNLIVFAKDPFASLGDELFCQMIATYRVRLVRDRRR